MNEEKLNKQNDHITKMHKQLRKFYSQ